jgi:hypothetical protein
MSSPEYWRIALYGTATIVSLTLLYVYFRHAKHLKPVLPTKPQCMCCLPIDLEQPIVELVPPDANTAADLAAEETVRKMLIDMERPFNSKNRCSHNIPDEHWCDICNNGYDPDNLKTTEYYEERAKYETPKMFEGEW